MARSIVVAGVASGVGKTTVTLALLEAYRRRGLTVQAFKVGPDFIDPAHHETITGRPSYTLDGWMCGREHALATVARHGADADLVVVEGVMGCFDGIDGASEEGSTAQMAKWLGAPVVLVVDVTAQSRSAAAVLLGFERFDPGLRVTGVIANRVGSAAHAAWVEAAVTAHCRAEFLGAVRRDVELLLPERHLGLVTAPEAPPGEERRRRLAEVAEESLDLDRLLALAAPLPGGATDGDATRFSRGRGRGPLARVGVARDVAFQFYYPENLDRLRDGGAELVFWSPLADETLPDVDGLYIGGGYPELHAARLAANAAMRTAVREFSTAGKPVYAECGGLMYLGEALEDAEGRLHPMVGVLPAVTRMRPRRLSLGYVEVTFTAGTPIAAAGRVARGHEFHYSTLDPVPASVPRVFRLARPRGGERVEGYLVGSTLLSYVHLHFASNPDLAATFVSACADCGREVRRAATAEVLE